MVKIFVSPCLLGKNVKYNGSNNLNNSLCELLNRLEVKIYSLCPEIAGGLGIPRFPCEILNNKTINNQGLDCSNEYHKGANKALELIKKENIKIAILKENSPSCGSHHIYDGTFSNILIEGRGITANLLINNGIKVFNEIELDKIEKEIKKLR